jgi:hypothetical protein
VGVGDSLEAAFTLAGPLRAGTWHLVGDAIIFQTVDARYDVIWRSAAGDQILATWQHHFDEPMGPAQFDAQPYEDDVTAPAADAKAGDQLVLRFSAMGAGTGPTAFIPNGDGAQANGRVPSIKLP